MAIFGSKIKNN